MEPDFQLQNSQIFLGSLANSFPVWLEQQQYSQIFVIADQHTQRWCLPVFLEKSGLSTLPTVTVVEAGEDHKNIASCEKIWQSMLSANLDRKSLVINLGGGVIGDMGGFCAATWKRGVDFVHLPTTLLAMTDAAIGGKLGIDFQGIKNIIGVFRQPVAVFVDPDFLKTLSERELRSGFAEVMKHALIGDPALFHQLSGMVKQQQLSGSFKLPESSIEVLQASIGVKVRIVTEDPHEKGTRMLLNFGHTIGHALESYFLGTDDPLTHGEAVAIGMICESVFTGRSAKIATFISSVYPQRRIPEAAFPILWAHMQQDKKNASGKVRMALPDELPFSMKIVEPTQEEIERSLLYYNELF